MVIAIMHLTTPLITAFILCPLAVLSQATSTQPDTSQQTIVPFSTWNTCTTLCGKLYDVQGACSPPTIPASNTVSCVCADARLQPWLTGTTGVCDNACTGNPDGMNQMRQWYLNLCQKSSNLPTTTNTVSSGTATAAPGSSVGPSSGSSGSGSANSNSTWLSTHWQWVIMVVILTLAMILAWVAGCFFRRRYIRRKEREFELRPPATPWANDGPRSPGPPVVPYGDPFSKGKDKEASAGIFVSRPPRPLRPPRPDEKADTKKWVVTERT